MALYKRQRVLIHRGEKLSLKKEDRLMGSFSGAKPYKLRNMSEKRL